jgi:rare lipoprotein A
MIRGGVLLALLLCIPLLTHANAPKRSGGYYLDDGPAEFSAADLERIPDAEPRAEPLHRFANNPYSVFGVQYTPKKQLGEFTQRGIGSWYGRRFHGQRTSSGEPYDMFAMTAAHPTLPIPSYARVTHLGNGKSVVVRINDRGPFHAGRIIDLSFTAAWKLGYAQAGSAQLEVTSLVDEGLLLASQPSLTPAEPDPIEALIVADAKKQASLPTIREAAGVFLQLAAFSNRDNADSFRSHLERELGDLADKLAVHAAQGLFRLRLGPFGSSIEARREADRLRDLLGMKAVVVQ